MLASTRRTVEVIFIPRCFFFYAARIANTYADMMFRTALHAEEIGTRPCRDLFATTDLAGTFLFLADKAKFSHVVIQEDNGEIESAGNREE